MKQVRTFTALIAIVLVTLVATTIAATEGVSPGAPDRMAQVNNACPTFSWGGSDGAAAYEVVAYVLPEDASQQVELTVDREALFTRVAGAATSWTPSADQCFAAGERYVWFVRAVTEMVDDQVIEAGEWSEGRYFKVPAGPTEAEVARAIEVLRRWEATSGGGSPTLFVGSGSVAVPVPAAAAASGPGSGPGSGSAGHRKSVPTAAAAVRGEHPGTAGEVYGLVGTSASYDGAGVAAANLDGGPDLVLDGSADGEPDTIVWQGGVDRSSATHQTFTMGNSGAGRLHLTVDGDMTSNVVRTEEVVVNGVTVIDDAGDWLGNGSMVPCMGCVASSDIVDGGVNSADIGSGEVTNTNLADGSVTADKIRDLEVGTNHLKNDSVTGVKIPPGTITSSHIADGEVSTGDLAGLSVTGGKIANDAVTGSKIADRAVIHDKIAIGTIDGYHLADGAIRAAKLADGSVTRTKIAADAVTSAAIYDRTIETADLADYSVISTKIASESIGYRHVAQVGGNPLYVRKGQIQFETAELVIGPGESGTAIAYCEDENDLPIGGFCSVPISGVNLVEFDHNEHWGVDSAPAGFSCRAKNDSPGNQTITAKISCISKAGP